MKNDCAINTACLKTEVWASETSWINELARYANAMRAWLLSDKVQVPSGKHIGGVMGWHSDGSDHYIYPEIIGYYLKILSFISTEDGRFADECTNRALMAMRWLDDREHWPTRDYVKLDNASDWRNAACFTFDLGMLFSGIATWYSSRVTFDLADRLLDRLSEMIHQIPQFEGGFGSHRLHAKRNLVVLEDRWSTRPGPHLAKVAGGIISSSVTSRFRALEKMSIKSIEKWLGEVNLATPGQRDVHPTLYYAEGLVLAGTSWNSAECRRSVVSTLETVLRSQDGAGSLPEKINPPSGKARGDVAAQTLRLIALVMHDKKMSEADLSRSAFQIFSFLVNFCVAEDGAVTSYARHGPKMSDGSPSNTWATIFCYQAFRFLQLSLSKKAIPPESLKLLV